MESGSGAGGFFRSCFGLCIPRLGSYKPGLGTYISNLGFRFSGRGGVFSAGTGEESLPGHTEKLLQARRHAGLKEFREIPYRIRPLRSKAFRIIVHTLCGGLQDTSRASGADGWCQQADSEWQPRHHPGCRPLRLREMRR